MLHYCNLVLLSQRLYEIVAVNQAVTEYIDMPNGPLYWRLGCDFELEHVLSYSVYFLIK